MHLLDILTACILIVLFGYAIISLIFRYIEIREHEKTKAAKAKEDKQLLNE